MVSLLFTYNADSETKLYLNGELSGKSSYYNGEVEGTASDLNIENNGGSRLWKGKIGYVCIYLCALNSEQVKQVMDNGAVSIG